ncbi:MAG: hypothetical protein K9K66_16700 [Desulfarculaceae bacterium]|nr:hypothetical protein [Desulfarculaceae bacterium]MCF8072630.1 hypothetical protein [Desulfarculaceae bacterium]MCF8103298.1 hypothetical protein [Desulfarculaceae bacterium]MCF8117780.1 hypothetical protein [Desulfarculaceae bacterium]
MTGQAPSPAELIGSLTLIAGEVNSGKTRLLARIMRAFAAEGMGPLALMDLAPETIRGVGGKLGPLPGVELTVHAPPIAAPRLSGRTPEEVLALARQNAAAIEECFDAYLAAPALVLFVNDVSLYLQAGDPARLQAVLAATPTVVMNGYMGASLGGGELGRLEQERMADLAARCAKLIRL